VDTISRILIIGYGSIGRRHADILNNLIPGCTIDFVSRHLGNTDNSYPDLSSVDNIENYQYYLVCSETAAHHSHVSFLTRHLKRKKIFIEKPVFMDIDRPYPVISDNEVFIGYNLRYHPVFQALREALRGHKILSANVQVGQYLPSWRPGTDYRLSYSANPSLGGGVLLDLSHELDYLTVVCGRITEIKALNRKISDLEIQTDDFMTAIGLTEQGVYVNLSMDYLSRISRRQIWVQCEDLTIFADFAASRLTVAGNDCIPQIIECGERDRNISYRKMHEDIINNGGSQACTFLEGLQILDTVNKIRHSNNTDWY
jgi:CMP-N,N'-diacetyllegionaminic acid synthase